LISVITVSLNSIDFIEDCLKSVISQDLKDFEYIVIDGGSVDGTAETIKNYENHITYWHSKPDRGLSHAFNLGVQNSKGTWLLFLNSDDTFADITTLSRMAKHLEMNKNADVVLGQVMVVSRDKEKKPIGGPYGSKFNWNEFKYKVTIPHQAAFINRNYFNKFGMFSEKYKVVMDYEHFLRGGKGLHVVFKPVMITHMKDGGITKKNILESHKAICRAQIESGALNKFTGKINYLYLNTRFVISGTILGKIWRKTQANKLQKIYPKKQNKYYDSNNY